MGLIASAPQAQAAGDPMTRLHWMGTIGRIDVSGLTTPFARTIEYQLAANNTITAKWSQYAPAAYNPAAPAIRFTKTKVGVAAALLADNTGLCVPAKPCDVYRPDATSSGTWTGTWEFIASTGPSTGLLKITWSNSGIEAWDVESVRGDTLGKMSLVIGNTAATNWPGTDPTYGSAYGSKQLATVYKSAGALETIPNTASGDFLGSGRMVSADGNGEATYHPSIDFNLLVGRMSKGTTNGLSALTSPTSTSTECPTSPTYTYGNMFNVYQPNSRYMTMNHWWRCLAGVVSPTNWDYDGGLHPYQLMQIIDDSNNLVGVIGIEAKPGSSPGHYAKYWLKMVEAFRPYPLS